MAALWLAGRACGDAAMTSVAEATARSAATAILRHAPAEEAQALREGGGIAVAACSRRSPPPPGRVAAPHPASSTGGAAAATGDSAARTSGTAPPLPRPATAKQVRAAGERGGVAGAASTPGEGRAPAAAKG